MDVLMVGVACELGMTMHTCARKRERDQVRCKATRGDARVQGEAR